MSAEYVVAGILGLLIFIGWLDESRRKQRDRDTYHERRVHDPRV